ncbi:MAG: hypothetical protein CM15mP36_01540 [Flavobacteriales bacterium]|nr:MAG: hypothetical protein CM15mP36_01540 [Flavobacteriales bacterium]
MFLNEFESRFISINNNIMENLNLSNSCINCENLLTNSLCGLHKIEVSEKYTCDSFENK